MLDQLLERLERRAGSAGYVIHSPRRMDVQVTVFRDALKVEDVEYLTGHGDTVADAIHNLLAFA